MNFEVPKLLSSCILRDFLKEDASPLADIEYDPVVKKYVGKGIPSKPRDEWEREVALDPGKLRGWAIVALPENVLAGRASVSNMPKAPAGTISLEIVIAQQFWGRRLGRQVAEPLIEHAFNHQRTVAVVAEVHPENQASIKLLQSLHFADTGKKNASEHLIFELGRLRYQQ